MCVNRGDRRLYVGHDAAYPSGVLGRGSGRYMVFVGVELFNTCGTFCSLYLYCCTGRIAHRPDFKFIIIYPPRPSYPDLDRSRSEAVPSHPAKSSQCPRLPFDPQLRLALKSAPIDPVFSAQAAQVITYSSVSALAFLVWDIHLTFDDEVEYIWKQAWGSPAKPLFLYIRYFSIIAQVVLLVPRVNLPRTPPSHYLSCRTWFIFKIVAFQSMLSGLGLILMLRVYALYNRARRVRSILQTLFSIEMLLILPIYCALFPLLELDEMCEPRPSPMSQLPLHLLSGVTAIVQVTLLVLTMIKPVASMRKGWRYRTPSIIFVVARDGAWVFGLMIGVVFLSQIFDIFVGPLYRDLVFTWFLTIVSFSGSRLILNLYGFGVRQSVEGDSVACLTSQIRISDLELFSLGPTDGDGDTVNVPEPRPLVPMDVVAP
ncbi:hypothetical protein JAAARDRAFT_585327 [Jaapia argillacea MUCL 33604]|uniref:DUF6533 domain-containing protein n=1 Tax=Jaapia argillacea MUCL 33604 TaxID=933084 RepID=A0A067PHJ0_9AGAM|nr:hypothetical protein JAAARDRAFT_585327 [Jaapia argillacea MUCL 33604]